MINKTLSEVNIFFVVVCFNEIIDCLFISEINTLLHYWMVIYCVTLVPGRIGLKSVYCLAEVTGTVL